MDLLHSMLLVAAGIAGGIMAALVGGAAVITFPALLAAGLPPVMATAANIAALTPGLFLAAISDRTQLPPFDRSFVALALASVVGARDRRGAADADAGAGVRVSGAAAARLRHRAVRLRRADQHVACGARAAHARPRRRRSAHVAPMVLPVSVYGGYFGAGLGRAACSACCRLATGGEYRPANVTKNLVAAIEQRIATVMVFAAKGGVNWPAALLMMAGPLFGR